MIFKCLHCQKEIKQEFMSSDFDISTRRHTNPNQAFLFCKKCGNVMIVEFNNQGDIKKLIATPEIDNEETKAMIQESRELLNKPKMKMSLTGKDSKKETKPMMETPFDPDERKCMTCGSCKGCCGEKDAACFNKRNSIVIEPVKPNKKSKRKPPNKMVTAKKSKNDIAPNCSNCKYKQNEKVSLYKRILNKVKSLLDRK